MSSTFSKPVNVFIRKEAGIPYDVTRAVLKAFTLYVGQQLAKGRSVRIDSLGTFTLRHQKGWIGQRHLKPKYAKAQVIEVESPEADYPHFTPSPKLKHAVWKVRPPVYKLPKKIVDADKKE